MSSKSAISFRTTYVLMGAVAVLLGGLAVYVMFSGGKKASTEGFLLGSFHSLGYKPQEITGLEIEKGGEKIVLVRQPDGRWRITQPIEARADSDRVEAIIQQLLAAKREEKGADVTPNLAVHGLDNPAVKLTLKKGERDATLSLGKVTVGGNEAAVYVLSSDDPKTPQAAKKQRLSALFKDKPPADAGTADMVLGLDDFRTKKLLGERIDLASAKSVITAIKLTEKLPKGEKVVAISRHNSERVWRFDIPSGYGDVEVNRPSPKMISDLTTLFNTVLSIEVPQVKDYLTDIHDLSSVGLDPNSPGVLRIDIERQNVGPETLWLSKEQVKTELDKVYARYEGDTTIAQVSAEKARQLRNFLDDPSTLRETTLLKLKPDRVDAIDVTIGKEAFELRKVEGNKWKVFEGDKVSDANPDPIRDLLLRLTQPNAVRGFPPADATDAAMGLDKPAVELKIWENGILPSSGTSKPQVKDAPTARLEFGKTDVGDIVFVRRYLGQAKSEAKVSEGLLALAKRGRLDYVDIALTGFNPESVQKVSFPRGNNVYEIERVDKDGRPLDRAEWKIMGPESKKSKLANSEKMLAILLSFSQLRAEKVVAEKPDLDQLKTMGLDPDKPRFKMTLKTKDNPADRVYFFGNDVAKKSSVFTKTSQSDFVFESPKAHVDLVTEGEIVDPVMYRLEASNVKGLKLKGWIDSSATGTAQLLELERKTGGVWAPKGNLAIDSAKVEDFLNAVLKPRAEAVLEKAGAKPEYGLDINKGALEVEIELNEGDPVVLTLGNRVSKESQLLYAMTNQAKGDVFTLKGDKLIPVKDKPTAFK